MYQKQNGLAGNSENLAEFYVIDTTRLILLFDGQGHEKKGIKKWTEDSGTYWKHI